MLPDGIKIGYNKYGRCLIATKSYKKGDLVYKGYCDFLDIDDYTLNVGDENFELNTVNTVKNPDGNKR